MRHGARSWGCHQVSLHCLFAALSDFAPVFQALATQMRSWQSRVDEINENCRVLTEAAEDVGPVPPTPPTSLALSDTDSMSDAAMFPTPSSISPMSSWTQPISHRKDSGIILSPDGMPLTPTNDTKTLVKTETTDILEMSKPRLTEDAVRALSVVDRHGRASPSLSEDTDLLVAEAMQAAMPSVSESSISLTDESGSTMQYLIAAEEVLPDEDSSTINSAVSDSTTYLLATEHAMVVQPDSITTLASAPTTYRQAQRTVDEEQHQPDREHTSQHPHTTMSLNIHSIERDANEATPSIHPDQILGTAARKITTAQIAQTVTADETGTYYSSAGLGAGTMRTISDTDTLLVADASTPTFNDTDTPRTLSVTTHSSQVTLLIISIIFCSMFKYTILL